MGGHVTYTGLADESQARAERLVERMHDRQGAVVGFVALPGGALAIVAGVLHWLVDPARGSRWFVATVALGMVGLIAILVAAVVAAHAEFRIARVEGATRVRSVGRGVRVVLGFFLNFLP